MGLGYLLDTNVIIEYLRDQLPAEMSNKIKVESKAVSVITKIELLSWRDAGQPEDQILRKFPNKTKVVGLNDSIVQKVIQIRKLPIGRPKLPDAIIAATALAEGYILSPTIFQIFRGYPILSF